MKLHPVSWFLISVLLLPLQALADAWHPATLPEVPMSGDSVVVSVWVTPGGRNLCDLEFPEPTVTRSGHAILVNYEVLERTTPLPPDTVCLSTFVPAIIQADVGQLRAGTYDVTFVGSTLGATNPTQTFSFTVGGPDGGPQQDTVQVPTNATWALASLLALMLGFAAVRLRSR